MAQAPPAEALGFASSPPPAPAGRMGYARGGRGAKGGRQMAKGWGKNSGKKGSYGKGTLGVRKTIGPKTSGVRSYTYGGAKSYGKGGKAYYGKGKGRATKGKGRGYNKGKGKGRGGKGRGRGNKGKGKGKGKGKKK
uniref:Uncharacterized protein n=1 Tax=Alexandrium monilatum TaxID=311494 RepID=A0A7S4SJY1_9DINO